MVSVETGSLLRQSTMRLVLRVLYLLLHVNITQLDKCHMFLSTIVSVAYSLQLSQVSQVVHKCRKCCSSVLP
jgi:hypothetical protein